MEYYAFNVHGAGFDRYTDAKAYAQGLADDLQRPVEIDFADEDLIEHVQPSKGE